MTEEKKPIGRPPKFQTPEEMQIAIDKYFESIDTHNKEMLAGGFINSMRPITITGLALSLDLTRKGLIEYSEKDDEFGNTVKKAKTKVELFNEEQLYRNNQVTGVIFNLKNNFNWSDKQDLNIGGQNGENPIETNLKVEFIKPKE